jgi:hypothetical protein
MLLKHERNPVMDCSKRLQGMSQARIWKADYVYQPLNLGAGAVTATIPDDVSRPAGTLLHSSWDSVQKNRRFSAARHQNQTGFKHF